MEIQINHLLSPDASVEVLVQQLSILYGAKTFVINSVPKFIEQATFRALKDALSEELDDTKKQLDAVILMLTQLNRPLMSDACLAMNAVVAEAERHVFYQEDNFYASDMSIIFYMNVIEHMQMGACGVLKLIAEKAEFCEHAQLIKECFDTNRDNARLLKVVTKEYLGVA